MDWYYGLRVNVFLGNDVSHCLFVGGCIDPNEFALLDRVIEKGMVIVDAGANDGLYTLFAAKKVGPNGVVVSIEPSRREFDRLQSNLRLNDLRNVRAFRIGLSNRSEQGVLKVSGYEHEGQNTFGEFSYEDVECSHTEEVPLKRLDALVREAGLSRVDLIKLDVEGGEFLALEGARMILEAHRPLLLLEVNDKALQAQSSSATEVLSLLGSMGYEVYTFDNTSGKPSKVGANSELSPNIVGVHVDRRWAALDSV